MNEEQDRRNVGGCFILMIRGIFALVYIKHEFVAILGDELERTFCEVDLGKLKAAK